MDEWNKICYEKSWKRKNKSLVKEKKKKQKKKHHQYKFEKSSTIHFQAQKLLCHQAII